MNSGPPAWSTIEDQEVANQQQHGGENVSTEKTDGQPAPAAFAGAARRRFTRTGAAAVGALLTLKSTPGMATTSVCTPSGPLGSGNVSRLKTINCALGRSPGYYQTHPEPEYWPSTCLPTVKFGTRFITACNTDLINKTMYQVSCDTGNQVARHLVAAYANALKRTTSSFLSVDKVKAIWASYDCNGTWSPSAGVTWHQDEILAYLKRTMI